MPSRSDDFQVALTDRVTAALWNAVFASVCRELDEFAALKDDIEATVQAVANGSLDTVLQGQLAGRLASTSAAFDALKTAIDQAKDQLAAIQAGIVIGSSVQITAGGMFPDALSLQAAIIALSAAVANDPQFFERMVAAEAALSALDDAVELRLLKSGGRLTGSLSSAVGTAERLTGGTKDVAYEGGNIRPFIVAGAVTFNLTGLAEGDVLQINVLFESGSIAVSGATQWELGGGQKSSAIADVGVTLVAGKVYRMIFEVVAGVRTAVFQ